MGGQAVSTVGIIPARAGFTGQGSLDLLGGGDHPRSRGVYIPAEVLRDAYTGSSPLARGLPRAAGDSLHDLRIIPARAGFTEREHRRGPERTDHPRSRGVYSFSSVPWAPASGSSPLARGLLRRRAADGPGPGIIPARAGFTLQGRRVRATGADHPRSRGVYTAYVAYERMLAGSSPLARGLQRRPDLLIEGVGIIPARAGFT